MIRSDGRRTQIVWYRRTVSCLLATLLLPVCLQGCIMGQVGPEATGLVPRGPGAPADVRRVTLRWEPRVQHVISRLPGGSGRNINTLIVGGLDRKEPIKDVRYDIEIYKKNPGAAEQQRAKNDYGRLWRAFWTAPFSYDDGESDIERERAYTLIHARQGIRESRYEIPFDLEAGAVYAWRVRPVYVYRGQIVAEDWMRENIVVLFGFISYGNSIMEFGTTWPPEFVLPSGTGIQ